LSGEEKQLRGPKRLYARARPTLGLLRQRWWQARRLFRVTPAPETFAAKVRYKMAFDRRPLLVTFADKLATRAYVEDVLGPGFLPELYLATDAAAEIRPDALPSEFALKPTHGSGAGVFVWSGADPTASLPRAGWYRTAVRPERLDWDGLRALCTSWLELRYLPAEWAYRDVPPGLLAEELLTDDHGTAADYRVFVFNGQARLVQINAGRFVPAHNQVFYTLDWRQIPMRSSDRPFGTDMARPPRLEEMLGAAVALARGTDLLRVDFYLPGDRLVVGELTSYPWGGTVRLEPDEAEHRVGSWWTLPHRYTQEEVDRLTCACWPSSTTPRTPIKGR
jgi:teichuronopeptide biosynthesis TupA-like protein